MQVAGPIDGKIESCSVWRRRFMDAGPYMGRLKLAGHGGGGVQVAGQIDGKIEGCRFREAGK